MKKYKLKRLKRHPTDVDAKARGSGRIKWGVPVDLPQARKWLPTEDEVLECRVVKILNGKYGQSYLVTDLDSDTDLFLPSHQLLQRLLESANVKEKTLLRLHCTSKGSRKAGDVYKYELQIGR